MASVLVPTLREHGMAATFLAGQNYQIDAPALAVFLPEDQTARAEALLEVARKVGLQVLVSQDVEARRKAGRLLMFAPHVGLDTRAFWKAVGLPAKGMDRVNVSIRALTEQRVAFQKSVGFKKTFFDVAPVGDTRFGCRVSDTPLGRVARHMNSGQVYREWELDAKGRRQGDVRDFFMRAENLDELHKCAKGVVRMMAGGGHRFNQASFRRIYEQIVAPEFREALTLNNLHEFVEAQCAVYVGQALQTGRTPRAVSAALNARLPNRHERGIETLRFDQFSTPLPVGAAASTILLPQVGETLLEPMVGNGVLAAATASRGVKVTGVEIDPARAERARAALGDGAKIVAASFENFTAQNPGAEFDLLLANPPFGTDFSPKEVEDLHGRRLRLGRPDQFYVFEALKSLKADGRAFVVMAADRMAEGRMEGARRHFDNWLRSTYDLAGSAVLDGGLYRKMGTTFPVHLYAIGPRREVPLSMEEVVDAAPAEIPVLHTTDELDTWAEQAAANMLGLVRARRPDFGGPDLAVDGRRLSAQDGSTAQLPSWDDAFEAKDAAEVFAALAGLRAVKLSSGAALRIEQGKRGWAVVHRAADGSISRTVSQETVGAGWTRDEALGVGLRMWSQDRAEMGAASQVAQSGPAAPASGDVGGVQPPGAQTSPEASTDGAAGAARSSRAAAGRRAEASERAGGPGRTGPARSSGRGRSAPAQQDEAGPEAPAARAVDPAPAETAQPAGEAADAPRAEAPQEAVVGAMPAPVSTAEFVEEDDPFLLPYEPMSKMGEPSTRIQRSLASPTMAALADVRRRYGDLDEMVAARLGTPLEKLGGCYSPEQIDALAMSFAAHDADLGFLNGDLMGVGKGRFLAGRMAAAIKEDRPVIFLTERPDLFQDMLARDVCDVTDMTPADLPGVFRPFVMNNAKEARIIDYGADGNAANAKVLFGFDQAETAEAKQRKAIPARVNLVLASYSQFSHAGGEWKAEALQNWIDNCDRPPLFVLDEAHRAAGDASKCGLRVTSFVTAVRQRGGQVLYGSATPLKSLRNIRVYEPILPNVGMSTDALIDLAVAAPLAIQEALAYEMARAGTMISREMDQQGVVREFINLVDLSPEKYEGLKAKMDEIADFLGEMMERSEEVRNRAHALQELLKDREKTAVDQEAFQAGMSDAEREMERDRRLSQVQANSISPASRFHTLSQYMVLGFIANFAEEMVLQSIASGRKPILVVENVGDSMVDHMLGLETDDEDAAPEAAAQASNRLDRYPNIGDVICRLADNMLWITERNGFGVVDKRRVTDLEPWLEDFSARVQEADLSSLSTSCIDDIRERLSQYEFSVGELTRRRYELDRLEDGTFAVERRKKVPMGETVREFNAGQVDVLVMNRSASSGISMQASPRNGPDLRQRDMIKLQLQADVTHERQIDGRIHRTGQVVAGRYTMPMSGLAASDRLFAMFNRKNRSMSAASQATRDNATNIEQAPDLLNPVGDRVVHAFLQQQPALADRFGLDVSEKPPEGIARQFMGRLVLLRSAEQTAVMAEVESTFRLVVADLEARGENPLTLNRYDWGATVEELETLIGGDASADASSKKPLTLNKVTYMEKVQPMRWDRVMEGVEKSREKWSVHGRFIPLTDEFPEFVEIARTGEIDFSAGIFDRLLNRTDGSGSLGLEIIPSKVAAETLERRPQIEKPNPMQKSIFDAVDRARFLADLVGMLEPGRVVGVSPDVMDALRTEHFYDQWGAGHAADAKLLPAVIKAVRYSAERPLSLGEWEVEFVVPGQNTGQTISLAMVAGLEKAATDAFREALSKASNEDDPDEPAPSDDKPPKFFAGIHSLANALAEGMDEEHGKEIRALFENSSNMDAQGHAFIKSFFDRVEPGEVRRSRYTLEGNVFQAVALSAQQRLGEKVIYTSDTGELRHAVMLKNKKLSKLQAGIKASLAQRTVPAPDDPAAVMAVLDLFQTTCEYSSARVEVASAEQMCKRYLEQYGSERGADYRLRDAKFSLERVRGHVIDALVQLTDHSDEERATLREALSDSDDTKFLELADRLVKVVKDAANAPTAISIGPNPFVVDGRNPVNLSVTGMGSIEAKGFSAAISEAAKGVAGDRQGAMILVTERHKFVQCHGKAPYTSGTPGVNWNVKINKLKVRSVATGAIESLSGLKQLLAIGAQHGKETTLHGALRAVFEEGRNAVNGLARELELESSLAKDDSACATDSSRALEPAGG